MKHTITLIAALLLAPLAALYADNEAAKRPNIVFIFADDWGWGDLSCHGHPWLKTPNLDRLVSEGTDFQQFNVLSPVCSPSRVAAMTGHYPARLGIDDVFGAVKPGPAMPDWLDPKAATTPRFLKAAGYRTAHFGKWHMGEGPEMAAYGIDESAVYHGPGPKIGDLHAIGSRAAEFIEANKGRPFFVDVWLHESHTAHSPTPESFEKWKHLDEQQQMYAAVITDGDNEVGKVLAALEKAGVADNTIVIFSSDNGPESTGTDKGRPGKGGNYYSIGDTGGLRGRKRSLFEGGVRVPFIVRWPGHTKAGVKNDRTAFSAVDLLPTLSAAAGVAVPADAKGDGENLLAAFNGEPIKRTRPIFWHWTGKDTEPDWWPRLGVRDGDWKLVMTFDKKRIELYQVTSDRAESHDVAKEHLDIVARLSQMALDFKATLPTTADPACVSKDRANAAPDGTKKPKQSAPGEPTTRKPKADRAKAFERLNANKDGVITLDEYKAGMKGGTDLDERFKRFDKDGDGKLTREEFIKISGK